MWINSRSLLSAILAVLAIGLVSLGAWFTLTHGADYEALVGSYADTAVGIITLVVVLAAGGLLAFAYNHIEAAYVIYKERSADSSEDRD